ncbi:unnamed protein product [Hydatigera taeniaeformis]|uniref:Uncharacterized protein n=1 Tax=Hydatigena taeniaeformis TaxID=6205 RepID=A0A0R3X9T0_HYDTA|nr:unnamed protein product [Hydatigera taeniaeformis]
MMHRRRHGVHFKSWANHEAGLISTIERFDACLYYSELAEDFYLVKLLILHGLSSFCLHEFRDMSVRTVSRNAPPHCFSEGDGTCKLLVRTTTSQWDGHFKRLLEIDAKAIHKR